MHQLEATFAPGAPLQVEDSHFGAVDIPFHLVQDLSSFTGQSIDFCAGRLNSYDMGEMSSAWRQAKPKTARDMRNFYSTTDLYLWELSKWHGSQQYQQYLKIVDAVVAQQASKQRHLRALDFGSGIGTVAVRLAEAGYDVTIADVPGITFDFAKHRLRRKNLRFKTLDVVKDIPRIYGQFDTIVCFDVLEHVVQPDRVWLELEKHLCMNGIAAVVASFDAQLDDIFPHHLRENYLCWGQGRWDMFMNGRGFRQTEQSVFQRRDIKAVIAARLRYRLWRATGLYMRHIPLRLIEK